MFCTNCGSSLKENARFCAKCGYSVGHSPARPTDASVNVPPIAAPELSQELSGFHPPAQQPSAPQNPAKKGRLLKIIIPAAAVLVLVAVGLYVLLNSGASDNTNRIVVPIGSYFPENRASTLVFDDGRLVHCFFFSGDTQLHILFWDEDAGRPSIDGIVGAYTVRDGKLTINRYSFDFRMRGNSIFINNVEFTMISDWTDDVDGEHPESEPAPDNLPGAMQRDAEAQQDPPASADANDRPDYITIRGVEYSTSLTELELNNMNLSNDDIEPLRHMIDLESLFLNHNHISDISPLVGLANLDALDLSYTQISDISLLVGLANLRGLGLISTQISDISPLAGLTKLELLLLDYTRISDLSPLAGLANLEVLGLSYTHISDISPLTGLTYLSSLYLNGNQVSDLSPLAGLTNLETLWLELNQIRNLSPLAGLINLRSLHLSDNQISNLSPLAGLTNLERLWLDGNQISYLSPLAGLTNLEVLWLNGNHISDISPLAGLTYLRSLYLNGNQIINLSPLAGLTNLEVLLLGGNHISNLSPLAGLSNLRHLVLFENEITDWSPVAHVDEVYG